MKFPTVANTRYRNIANEDSVPPLNVFLISFQRIRVVFSEKGRPRQVDSALRAIAALDKLPAIGAYIVALPMKIKAGSGGPLRIVAWVSEKR